MRFHVGQKVVCVDDVEPNLGGIMLGMDGLKRGHIYTVREVGLLSWLDDAPCIRVEEIFRDGVPLDEPFWARRFRPVVERKTDISVFTAMLEPHDYNPTFVERVLDAEAAPNEASVLSTEELLEWLDKGDPWGKPVNGFFR